MPKKLEIYGEGGSEEEALEDALDTILEDFKDGLYISRDLGNGWKYEMIVAGRNDKFSRMVKSETGDHVTEDTKWK
jgi:hypothetical protein